MFETLSGDFVSKYIYSMWFHWNKKDNIGICSQLHPEIERFLISMILICLMCFSLQMAMAYETTNSDCKWKKQLFIQKCFLWLEFKFESIVCLAYLINEIIYFLLFLNQWKHSLMIWEINFWPLWGLEEISQTYDSINLNQRTITAIK